MVEDEEVYINTDIVTYTNRENLNLNPIERHFLVHESTIIEIKQIYKSNKKKQELLYNHVL